MWVTEGICRNFTSKHRGNRNVQSFRHAIKRLEEVSISCKGDERILLLRRWLVSLKQIEKFSNVGIAEESISNEDYENDEFTHPILVTYFDSDLGREKLNFRDVFLHSQALDGIILSTILEVPNEEEISLLLEIFRLSLMGGKEVHNAIISNIQSLAKSFSSYHDEVLMKREELLQYAQIAVSGLKMNADIARIDLQVSALKTKLNRTEIEPQSGEGDDKLSRANGDTTIELLIIFSGFALPMIDSVEGPPQLIPMPVQEGGYLQLHPQALKEVLFKIRMFSKLEALLMEKKAIRSGDSPESHAQKVGKLKILSESLANSTSKAERRILDHRSQKEEALYFRLAKATEVNQVEKDMVAEVEVLERQKDELEMELRKVDTSLSAAKTRLRNAREERDQFYDASNEILQHLHTKEEELSKSITSYRTEANVVTSWIKFMEDAWGLQSSFAKHKEKQIDVELDSNARYHVNLIMQRLPEYENELESSITRFRVLVRRLKSSEEHVNTKESNKVIEPMDEESLLVASNKKSLEEEYMGLESKLTTAFDLVESIKQTCNQNEACKDKQKVNDLFDSFGRMNDEFKSLEKPTLQVEVPKQVSWRVKPLRLPQRDMVEKKEPIQEGYSKLGPVIDGQNFLDSEEPTPESESAKLSKGHLVEEIIDWEFDGVVN